jgi:hypothetical protein
VAPVGRPRVESRRRGDLRSRQRLVDTGLVFIRAEGSALVPDSDSHRFDRLVIQAGLPSVCLRGLRHVAASVTYERPGT